MRSGQSSHSPPIRQPLLPTVPNPPVPHSNPISSRPPPSEWDQAQHPPGGMLDPGGLLRQPGSPTALPRAAPSPLLPMFQRVLSLQRFLDPFVTSVSVRHQTCEPLFLPALSPNVMCVCCYFYVHLLYVLVKVAFPLVRTYQAIRESAVNGLKKIWGWELDKEIALEILEPLFPAFCMLLSLPLNYLRTGLDELLYLQCFIITFDHCLYPKPMLK